MKKQFLRQRINNRSFYFTALFSFIITSALSALLLTIFLTINYVNFLVSTIQNYNQQLLSQTNYAIDQLDSSVDRIAISLLNNNSIIAFLSSWEPDSTIPTLASRELDDQLLVLSYVDSVYLYNSSKDFVYSSKTGFQQSLKDFDDQEVAANLNDPDFLTAYAKQPFSTHKDPTTGAANTLTYYYPDNRTSSSENPNVIIINVHVSALTNSISSMKELTSATDSNFVLLDQEYSYLTGVLNLDKNMSQKWLDSVLPTLSSEHSSGSSFTKINGTRYFQINTNSNLYGWNLLNFVPASTIFQDIVPTALITFLIFIGVLLISFFVCLHFTHQLNTPVETLARILSEKRPVSGTHSPNSPKEFQKILDSVSTLLENNQQLRTLQQKTRYSHTQECLNSLVSNHNLDSPALLQQKLEHLRLSYLDKERLCMAVIKVDNYQQFISTHNAEELWVIRFSIVNIIEELASTYFSCNAFSRTDEKFVLLMTSDFEKDDSEAQLMDAFRSIQKNLESHLHITVSVAFSTIFHGLDNLPAVYRNMERSLLLKMRYGHNCIIDPYQSEQIPDDTFHVSYRQTCQLIDRLIAGEAEAGWLEYKKLTKDLFCYDYNEIMSTLIHVVYNIYERIIEKYPMMKDSVTVNMRTLLSELPNAEISDDIHVLVKEFLNSICVSVQKLKVDPDQQNSSVIAEKITQIICKEYTNPALCLCSIADEINLSSNYTGHIFKQQMKKSVSQYILETRMEKLAYYLQNTSLPLSNILDKIGMEKNNYFYTRFKNYFGMSLSEYKQKFQISSGDE